MAHGASHTPAAHGRQTHYAVPQPMPWPIMGSASLFMMALGAVFVFNGARAGWVGIAAGFLLIVYMMVRWFGEVISESEGGKYGRWEDVSFRWGMSFFITRSRFMRWRHASTQYAGASASSSGRIELAISCAPRWCRRGCL
jgi:hypothetical protein